MKRIWKIIVLLVLLVSLLPIAPVLQASAASMLTLPDGEYSIDTDWYRNNELRDPTSLVGKTGTLSVKDGQQKITLSGVKEIVSKIEVNGVSAEIKDGKATFSIDDITQTATVYVTYNPTPTFEHTLDYTVNFKDYPIATSWYYDGKEWSKISMFLDTTATVDVSDGKKIVTFSNVSSIIDEFKVNGTSNDISDGKATFEVDSNFSDVTITISYSFGTITNTHDFIVKFTNTSVPPVEQPEEDEKEEPTEDTEENDSVIETPGQAGDNNTPDSEGDEVVEPDKTPVTSPDSNDTSESTNSELDPANLADGTYSIDINLLHATKDEASKMANYIVSPALLTVENGIYTVTITVIGSEITNLQIEGNSGFEDMNLISEDTENGTSKYSFVVTDLTKLMNGKADVYVLVNGFDYQATYDFRYQFDISSLSVISQASDLDAVIDQVVNEKQESNKVNLSGDSQETVTTEEEGTTIADSSEQAEETTVEESEESLESLSFEREAATETVPDTEEPVENAKTLDTAQIGFYVMLLLVSSIMLARKWKVTR